MNKVYKLVWNTTLGCWVAVHEMACGHGKQSGVISAPIMHARLAQRANASEPWGPAKRIALAVATACGLISHVAAAPVATQLPTNGQVSAGAATISQTGAVMNIQQTSVRAAINWQSFDIGSSAKVNFQQPSANSVALNRVQGNNPSQIFGQLNANGQVLLVNPLGVYFAPGASVNVGGLVATTHRMSDQDFMAGSTTFDRNGATASVINEGEITSALTGYVALLAPEVRNQGVIVAQAGTVALASGEKITLNMNDNSLSSITVNASTIDALVENRLAVKAPGGQIILSAQAVNSLNGAVVNTAGATLEASGISSDGGRIVLNASSAITHNGDISADGVGNGNGGEVILLANLDNPQSVTSVSASIRARGGERGGDGGFVETSASKVQIGKYARVDTRAPQGSAGHWLIDPTDFTISSGTNAQTVSGIGASTLQDALSLGNVSIATSATANGTQLGDIYVAAPVAWSANRLTLSAHNDINISADLTITSSGSLTLNYGQGAVALGNTSNITVTGAKIYLPASTTNYKTKLGSDGAIKSYTVITQLGAEGSTTTTDLQGMVGSTSKNYALGADIDASATSGWTNKFIPVPLAFQGEFDGLGHTITNLTIYKPTTDRIGLFQRTWDTTVRNVGLVGGNVTGKQWVGALIGDAVGTKIHNSFSSATVVGTDTVGGLVGNLEEMSSVNVAPVISKSYATGSVTATSRSAGGLAGSLVMGTGQGTDIPIITRSYATGAVASPQFAGGLLATCAPCSVRDSYASGTVTVTSAGNAGGLIGAINGSIGLTEISGNYATGTVTGASGSNFGGLIGIAADHVTIARNYATGNVTATNGYEVGGLVGHMEVSTTVSNSYATGDVSGIDQVGGLVGQMVSSTSSITNSYSVGLVSGNYSDKGGLLGRLDAGAGPVSSSYWDITSSGIGTSAGGAGATGMATTDMQDQTKFVGWDFAGDANGSNDIWSISSSKNGGYPCLTGLGSCTFTTVYLQLNTGGTSIYGDAPDFSTFSFGTSYGIYDAATNGNLLNSFSPTGTITWNGAPNASSDVGTYALTYGSGLDLGNADYVLVAGSGTNWQVIPRQVTVTPTSAQNKTYGQADPTLTYSVESAQVGLSTGLVNGDNLNLSGALVRAAGEDVNTYAISAGTLAAANTNYIVSLAAADFTIARKSIQIDATVVSKTYGDADPVPAVALTSGSSLAFADQLVDVVGTITRQTGEDVGDYDLVLGSGTKTSNYLITFTADNNALTVSPAALTVTANDGSKTYDGQAYSGGNGVRYAGFVNNEDSAALGGTLTYLGTSQGAVDVGTYVIAPSGLTSSNYTISFADGVLTVMQGPETVTTSNQPAPPRLNDAPSYVATPARATASTLEVSISTDVTSNGIVVKLMDEPKAGRSGFISVSVPKEIATGGIGFGIPLPEKVLSKLTDRDNPNITTENGDPLPGWLEFDAETGQLVASAVPDSAFPIRVLVATHDGPTMVVISERQD